jgi:hypothetical protein
VATAGLFRLALGALGCAASGLRTEKIAEGQQEGFFSGINNLDATPLVLIWERHSTANYKSVAVPSAKPATSRRS